MNAVVQKRWLVRALYISVIITILAVERVAGVPILFLGIFIQEYALADRNPKKIVVIAASIGLAIFYQMPLVNGLAVVAVGIGAWLLSASGSSSKTARLLVSVACMVAVLVVWQHQVVTGRTMIYGLMSVFILVGITRSRQQRRF